LKHLVFILVGFYCGIEDDYQTSLYISNTSS
jgi:hypothetical protein